MMGMHRAVDFSARARCSAVNSDDLVTNNGLLGLFRSGARESFAGRSAGDGGGTPGRCFCRMCLEALRAEAGGYLGTARAFAGLCEGEVQA